MAHSTTPELIDKIVNFANAFGVNEASDRYKVSLETINRYKRDYKERHDGTPPTKNILIFDIETAPMEVYAWGIWKQNIGINQIIQDWTVLCWAAKWLDSDQIITDTAWESGKVRNDKSCCASLAKVLCEADIVVAHNGDRFDIKKMNTRFLKHGIKEPTPFKSVDTLKIVKDRFAITSNKLDYVGKFLEVGQKIKHSGFELWKNVLKGNKQSQTDMLEYNVGDIALLEQVYLKIRSWDKRHPNVNIQFSERRCPVCGSERLKSINDVYTPVAKYSAHMCKDCGKYSRTGQHKKTKAEMGRTQRNIV